LYVSRLLDSDRRPGSGRESELQAVVLSSAEKATRANLDAELHSNFKGTRSNIMVAGDKMQHHANSGELGR
jgi:hypothetical protein